MRITSGVLLLILGEFNAPLWAQGGENNLAANGVSANVEPASTPQGETLSAYDQWADRQDYYPRHMILAMRARLSGAFDLLPPGEATRFRDQFVAKLNILVDPQWQHAEQWLVQTLAVASESYANKIWTMLPDIVVDSPNDIRAKLRNIAIRAMNVQQVRQGFEQTRQTSIQVAREDVQRQTQFNTQLRASMTYSTPNLYSPAAQGRPVPSQRYSDYFNHRYGSPFSYAFGGVWFF